MTEPATPLMQQYHSIKARYPHALLLFRLGDFYELFYEDAMIASRELQITLTSRNREKGQPIPMCGVPYHAAEGYLARLIRAGFKIAICDQMEQPGPGKKLVRREVVRVITPGTATDLGVLDIRENLAPRRHRRHRVPPRRLDLPARLRRTHSSRTVRGGRTHRLRPRRSSAGPFRCRSRHSLPARKRRPRRPLRRSLRKSRRSWRGGPRPSRSRPLLRTPRHACSRSRLRAQSRTAHANFFGGNRSVLRTSHAHRRVGRYRHRHGGAPAAHLAPPAPPRRNRRAL